jgi:hypothetical protein
MTRFSATIALVAWLSCLILLLILLGLPEANS